MPGPIPKIPGPRSLLLSAVLALAAFYLVVKAAEYVRAHWVIIVLVLAAITVLMLLAVRPFAATINSRFFARFILVSGSFRQQALAARKRTLPEPLKQEGAGKAFTEAPAPALETGTTWAPRETARCHWAGCTNALPADPADRWRAGRQNGGGPGAVKIGTIHEFCSEPCTNAWLEADATGLT